ncbi:hypothetical protein PRK78_003131 [Emydomyces testavorans]|uniref:Flavin reductase like domain-containing protein n=1 Tax=Emydomyces testavorans TaxID=2070801 RepID=A0AAF0DGC3_9EURO|nr:hypothetical protein PRK78_003131 [Emydomyces testavorans]
MPFLSAPRLAQSQGISSLLSLSRASTFTALPPQWHFRRHYGRMLGTIVSKHVTSITDVVRAVLPPGLAPLPREVEKFMKSFLPTQNQQTEYVSQSTPRRSTEFPEDDISTEPYSATTIDTNIQSQVRKLMRLVPHPVAIITSTQPNSRTGSPFRGMTVSSFNTVTLYPKPIVSFNVKLPSETYDAIRSSQRFLVHLLSSNRATAKLAREFSRGHENVLLEDKKHTFRFTSPTALDRPPVIGEGEPPRLVLQPQKSDGSGPTAHGPTSHFPFVLECRYSPSSARVGDHEIVLGTVVKIYPEEAQNHPEQQQQDTTHSRDDLCLTYADTRFWKMGEHIAPLPKPDKP